MVGSEVRKSFQMIGTLPCVPPDDVDMAWRHHKPLLLADMVAFAEYMEYTWLGKSSSDATHHLRTSSILQPGGRVEQRLQKYRPNDMKPHRCTKAGTFSRRAEDCEVTHMDTPPLKSRWQL